MNKCKLLLLVSAILTGVLSQVGDCRPPHRPAADNDTASPVVEIPASYDPAILKKIPKLKPDQFAFPVVTVVSPDSANHPKGFDHAAIVWMQIRVGEDHMTHEAKVVYCSAPGVGFEQAAIAESNRRPFATLSGDRAVGWFWYQVLFTGTCGSTCSDTLDLPKPDEFIACEQQPQMTYYATPYYPRVAKHLGQTGVVWVKELVDRNGFTISAMVAKSSGVELLDQSAVAAAYTNRFKPAIRNGQPVALWVAYKVEFRLRE